MNTEQTLSEILKENTKNTKIRHDALMNKHDEFLKMKVLRLLENHSNMSIDSHYELAFGTLYFDNYYDNNCKETLLGQTFYNDVGYSITSNELEALTYRLEKYLLSQGLSVIYLSHCNIRISWYC